MHRDRGLCSAPCSSSGAMLPLLGKLNQPSNSQGARCELVSFNLVCAKYKFIFFFFLNSGRGYAKPLTLRVHISFKTCFLQPTLNCVSHFPLLSEGSLSLDNGKHLDGSRITAISVSFFFYFLPLFHHISATNINKNELL